MAFHGIVLVGKPSINRSLQGIIITKEPFLSGFPTREIRKFDSVNQGFPTRQRPGARIFKETTISVTLSRGRTLRNHREGVYDEEKTFIVVGCIVIWCGFVCTSCRCFSTGNVRAVDGLARTKEHGQKEDQETEEN
jgi:hypothetical protein